MPSLSDHLPAVDPPAPTPGRALASYDRQQQHALLQYARLDKLRREVLPLLDPSDYRVKLIHKALFSTYRDLQALGLGREARGFREQARTLTGGQSDRQ